jgi:ABC-type sugar transport system ATPase subunit
MANALQIRGIRKSFSSVRVLRGIDLELPSGSVTGLVGHNGAGKSTLLRVISGAHGADHGSVEVDGAEVPQGSPAASLAAGVSTVYQELSLLPNLTVAQNVFLGRETVHGGLLDRRAMRARTVELAERFHLDVEPDRRLADYPVATRQLLEVAIAVARDAKYLLLDEPTTSLEGSQVTRFLDTVRTLAQEDGLGILLVDHKLDELYAVADRIVALVDGEIRIFGRADEVDRDQIVQAIAGDDATAGPADAAPGDLGRAADDGAGPSPSRPGHPARTAASDRSAPIEDAGDVQPSLEITDLRGPALDGVSMSARPGRVLGIYGLIGAGRTELMRSLVGLEPIRSGGIALDGRPYRPDDPLAAQRRGLVYLTEERKWDGIVGGLDAATNVMLPVTERFRRLGLLDRRALRREADELMDRMRVRGDRDAPVERLSGGNQQKVLLARVLAQRPRVLLLDEPTKGVDIGVKTEIHQLLRSLAHEDGLTVVVVSSEEEEIIELADDVITLADGSCDGTVMPASELSVARLRETAWSAA